MKEKFSEAECDSDVYANRVVCSERRVAEGKIMVFMDSGHVRWGKNWWWAVRKFWNKIFLQFFEINFKVSRTSVFKILNVGEIIFFIKLFNPIYVN